LTRRVRSHPKGIVDGTHHARVGYGTWWKFSFPLLLILGALSAVGLAIASAL
jgi:uncharacterized ion transporter superfamily protein YfcC